MEMKIREFHHSDIPHLMEICLKTGDDGKDGTDCYSDPHFIGQLYALPYVIHNPELCMVVHEHEIPVGYILGTDDTREFYRWMENQYLPTLRRRYPSGMQCASQTEEFFLSLMHTDRSPGRSRSPVSFSPAYQSAANRSGKRPGSAAHHPLHGEVI
jgi:hypothetical protein